MDRATVRRRTFDALASHRCNVFRHQRTGKPTPWQVRVDGDVVAIDVPAAFSTNAEELEIEAVLGSHVIGLLTGVTAAAHVRAGRLVPLLTKHVSD